MPVVAMFVNRSRQGIHILIFFLANFAKGNMSFCHHFMLVVCHLFTFHILIFSSENLQPNELKLGMKSTNQKQELPVAVMFNNGSGRNEHSL
jgi:hypothetical protein